MKAITFENGKAIDPETGEELKNIPPEILEQFKKAEQMEKNQKEIEKIEDVTNQDNKKNDDGYTSLDVLKDPSILNAPKESEPKPEPKKESKKSAKKNLSKYEVGPDSSFMVEFGILAKDDRYVIMDKDEVKMTKGAESHWAKFKMWTYEQELDWKNEATEFDSTKRVHMLNTDKLNEIKLRNLILNWSFSEADNSLKMLHVNGVLADESLKVFYSIYPSIARHIVDGMNDVLEFNG